MRNLYLWALESCRVGPEILGTWAGPVSGLRVLSGEDGRDPARDTVMSVPTTSVVQTYSISHKICTRFCFVPLGYIRSYHGYRMMMIPLPIPWWCHDMETLSILLALCEGIHRWPVAPLRNRMMTSWHGNELRITGLFVRGMHWWPVDSPHKGTSNVKRWGFLCS